jgi:predicted MFS family arabinose efflux permease
VSLALLPVVELRAASPMLPLALFRSPAFTLANLLTLLLYAAFGVVMFLVPMNLIQVQHYSATEAGAAFLPLPLIVFAMSRWSGGLVARVGSRLPLGIGPAIAAIGIAFYTRPFIGGSYWVTFFPAVAVLGLGMAVTVAPLTTTVMGAVDPHHAGVASGVNNAVARVAGLLAIAVFGVVLTRTFEARVTPALDQVRLPSSTRQTLDRELPKMAGVQVESVSAIEPAHRAAVRRAIDVSFVAAFRRVMLGAALLSLAAGIVGAALPRAPKPRAAR